MMELLKRYFSVLGMVAVFLSCSSIFAQEAPRVQIFEMGLGVNGNSKAQFIQLKLAGAEDNLWGPNEAGGKGKLQLEFFDASNNRTGVFNFPNDAPVDGNPDGFPSVLIATQSFTELEGAPQADFELPEGILATGGGRVCLMSQPEVAEYELELCLSYGDFHSADALPEGIPDHEVEIISVQSLRRVTNFGIEFFSQNQRNEDFSLSTIQARNSSGDEFTGAELSPVEKGRNLFHHATFQGNGRTCSTCHKEEEGFSLSSETIEDLDTLDPLFVFKLNPALSFLEDAKELEEKGGLIKTRPQGFDGPSVFRAVPALINLDQTAPYGWTGDFDSLEEIIVHSVADHLPNAFNRNADPTKGAIAFRTPTEAEIDLLKQFLQSLKIDASLELMMASGAFKGKDHELIRQGRDIFMGNGNCFQCHSGPSLSDVHPSLIERGVVAEPGNGFFNTGAAFGFSTEDFDPDEPQHPDQDVKFNVPSLVAVGLKKSFFHNNIAKSLESAAHFYCIDCTLFSSGQSPSAPLFADITQGFLEIGTFLESLVEPDPECVSGDDCNENGIGDVCEIALFPERDCNGNGIIDICEAGVSDCDGNSIDDSCEISQDQSLDCNLDEKLDSCQIAAGELEDCDGDGILDSCEGGDVIQMDELPDSKEIRINGIVKRQFLGVQISEVGDVNGDGFGDIAVAARRQVPGPFHDAYILFGSADARTRNLQLEDLDVSHGVILRNSFYKENTEWVSAIGNIGDVNGDGFDDVGFCDPLSTTKGRLTNGRALILFGRENLGSDGPIDLLNPPDSESVLMVHGHDVNDRMGPMMAAAGDVDNDGFNDFLLGVVNGNLPGAGTGAGKAFIVYGDPILKTQTELDLNSQDFNRVTILGVRGITARFGSQGSTVGDINDDGFADFIISAPGIPTEGGLRGVSFLFFGGSHLRALNRVQFAESLNEHVVFRLPEPLPLNGVQGLQAHPLGDVSGDRVDDFMITGERVHVIYGKKNFNFDTDFSLDRLNGVNGYSITAPFREAHSIGGVLGDYTSDSLNEIFYTWRRTGDLFIRFGFSHNLPEPLVGGFGVADGQGILLFQTEQREEFFSETFSLNFEVSEAGDFDGDGHDDLLLSQDRFSNSEIRSRGRIRILFGPFYPDDCNDNSIPDECEFRDGLAVDENGDGVPDDCQKDSDGDGIFDPFDVCPEQAGGDFWNTDGDSRGDYCDDCARDALDQCLPEKSSQLITDQAGGLLEVPDGSFSLEIPQDVLTDEFPLSVTGFKRNSEINFEGRVGTLLNEYLLGPDSAKIVGPFLVHLTWEDENDDGIIDGTDLFESDLVPVIDGEIAEVRCEINDLCSEEDNTLLIEIFTFGDIALVHLPAEDRSFKRGDANIDGLFNISDAIFILSHLFLPNGEKALCKAALDVNDDELIDVSDPIFALVHQFTGGKAPPFPFQICGPDFSPPGFPCDFFPLCDEI